MKPKHVYLLLCVVGTIFPYLQLIEFIRDNGPDVRAFHDQLFRSHVGAFFGLDVIISSIVLWVLVAVEGRRTNMKHLWAPIVGNLLVGVSLGLPLFLYMREARISTAARA
jgi:uncharacterized protein DUF2834